MSNPNATLGLSCPSGGKFYVCDTATIRFLGCCTSDPCSDGSGECPTANLRTSSFSSDHYDDISAQNCVGADAATSWFTCKASPPFLGCCKSDPCAAGSCAQANLIAAQLSDDQSKAQVFIGSATTTATATGSATATSSPSSSQSGTNLSTGAIAGIAVGAASVVLILLAFLAYKCCRGRRREAQAEAEKTYSSSAFPYSRKSRGATPKCPAVRSCSAAVSPSTQSYHQNHSSISSYPGTPAVPAAFQGYQPYSSTTLYDPAVSPRPPSGVPSALTPGTHLSVFAPADPRGEDNRHLSQGSMGSWQSIASRVAYKEHPISMELDGVPQHREHPASMELDGVPQPSKHPISMELDGREMQRPANIQELPAGR